MRTTIAINTQDKILPASMAWLLIMQTKRQRVSGRAPKRRMDFLKNLGPRLAYEGRSAHQEASLSFS
jgi:hypothetical protein